jgi:hypothetical protein
MQEDVIHFLANFSEDKPGSSTTSDAHTAQTEAFVKALAHQLPRSCFHVRIPDHPLLLGIGAQFEGYRGKSMPCVLRTWGCVRVADADSVSRFELGVREKKKVTRLKARRSITPPFYREFTTLFAVVVRYSACLGVSDG